MDNRQNAEAGFAAAQCSAATCEWENVVPGPCTNTAEFIDATGKRLCACHARHLERRFRAKMRRIEMPPNDKLSDPAHRTLSKPETHGQ